MIKRILEKLKQKKEFKIVGTIQYMKVPQKHGVMEVVQVKELL